MAKVKLIGKAFYKRHVHGAVGILFDPILDSQVRFNLDKFKDQEVMVEIKALAKPITKGARSQMAWIHGQCSAIADQLNILNAANFTTDEIKYAMKRMAATERAFPVKMAPDGIMQPISLSEASREDATALIDTILDFAYLHKFYLIEYDEKGKPVKTVEGKAIYETRRDYDK